MITIIDYCIKVCKPGKEVLLGAYVVEIENTNIIYKNDVEFRWCDSLTSVSGATFSGKVYFWFCDSLVWCYFQRWC